ncbi:MAG TPA: MFS transporter [Streptosporangiaceae bacterium]
MSRSLLRMDVSPLRGSGQASFRVLYASRSVTLFGTQATDVALLVQARQLTGSAFAVGLLGVAELIPLVVFGLYGGVLADRLDRRRLLRWCEAGLGLLAAALAGNAVAPHPAVWPLYALAAAMSMLTALQRPSLEAAIPRTVPRQQLAAAAALLSISGDAGAIIGATVGGAIAAGPGAGWVYGFDTASFAVSFLLLLRLRPLPPPAAGDHPPGPGPRAILSGLRYAWRRRDLLGSYLADLAAMTLAYPNALIPFIAAGLHASWATGLLFAAPSAGALAVSATGGWVGRVHRYGRAIALAAAGWGLAITGFGLAPDLAVALGCLFAAGAADMVSGIFRDTLWNQTIPDELRGRLAGVEMLSYSIGPSAGQLRAGGVASVTTPRVAATSGGLLCVAAVGAVCLALPSFWTVSGRGKPAVSPAPGALTR